MPGYSSITRLSSQLGGVEVVRVGRRHPGGTEVDSSPAKAVDKVEASRRLLPHLHGRSNQSIKPIYQELRNERRRSSGEVVVTSRGLLLPGCRAELPTACTSISPSWSPEVAVEMARWRRRGAGRRGGSHERGGGEARGKPRCRSLKPREGRSCDTNPAPTELAAAASMDGFLVLAVVLRTAFAEEAYIDLSIRGQPAGPTRARSGSCLSTLGPVTIINQTGCVVLVC